ncbi:39S ribosomal protein L39, mitochondrial [Cephus cinctus]|uniref:Large ribosomal subunit protein mL39 n=1 Tax=Cephus cinctus TaxID=211228 RepID=A0AAJ7FKF8_CEPCN|nr:39S ribosomal protein L39, mitochondrial [Cephus cinctus]XP_015596239.1 39S ribosomal protein L39, mitochondrial [Cephus cinctus]XP_015596240.1 39S ribosomal protein L39, mitochondrial [Cephus cinctus]
MFHGCRQLYTIGLRFQSKTHSRCIGTLTKAEAKKKRNQLYDEELKRQRAAVGRIEKIDVKYHGPTEEVILAMNKNLSTPHDCAKHISEGLTKVAALALVNEKPWDMHRPLTGPCDLTFTTLKAPNISTNRAFWRTCSLILGAVAENAFKDDVEVHLHSFPAPSIKSGSFISNVYLNLPDWQPTVPELQAMSALFVKLILRELPVERLVVQEDLAIEMFQENRFKIKQIPDIAKHNENRITLYRIGDHIDISKGPMVGNTSLVGRTTVAAVHKIQTDEGENLYRFQGVAIPSGILMNSFAYGLLEERAKKLNNVSWMPQRIEEDMEEKLTIAAQN